MKPDIIIVEIRINVSFWDAVKMRIAGKASQHFLNDVKRQLQLLTDSAVAESIDRIQHREIQ